MPLRILLTFRNSLPAMSREYAVLTPDESVSIEVRRNNGRLVTFSSATPFGQIGPGYVYGIFTSVHPVGVKGLASWRRTVVQSAPKTPPFSRSDNQREVDGTEKDGERIEGLRRRGCCTGGWLTASLPTLLIVRARWPSVPRHCR